MIAKAEMERNRVSVFIYLESGTCCLVCMYLKRATTSSFLRVCRRPAGIIEKSETVRDLISLFGIVFFWPIMLRTIFCLSSSLTFPARVRPSLVAMVTIL